MSRELLEPVPNPYPDRAYLVEIRAPEFTCVCPRTGQPDYATIEIDYEPAASIVELKSLKMYLQTYRNEGTFHEAVTNRIRDDLVAVLSPRRLTIRGCFHARGGISTTVTARYPDAS